MVLEKLGEFQKNGIWASHTCTQWVLKSPAQFFLTFVEHPFAYDLACSQAAAGLSRVRRQAFP